MPTDEPRHAGQERPESGGLGRPAWLNGARVWWLAAALAAVALVFATSQMPRHDREVRDWLYGGRAFSAEQADRMIAALRGASIACTEQGGKVGVAPERRAEAMALLAKQGLGWRSIADLLDEEPNAGSPFETAQQRERSARRARERSAAALIEQIPGVVRSHVVFAPTQAGTALSPASGYKATAFIESEHHQRLEPSRVARIAEILTRFEGVIADDIRVMDLRSEHVYPSGAADMPATLPSADSSESLRARIVDEIDIPGVEVSVRLEHASAPTRPDAVTLLNQPLGDVSEIRPEANFTAEPAAARATVIVQVPRGHLLRAFEAVHPRQTPTPDRLTAVIEEVREKIRGAVRRALPDSVSAEIKIAQIDPGLAAAPQSTPGQSERESAWATIPSWLPIAGGVALAVCVLLLISGGWVVARRGRAHGGAAPNGGRFAAHRVYEQAREFARREPAAAAGVLHAWIQTGGQPR